MKKIALFLLGLFLLTGCDSNINDIKNEIEGVDGELADIKNSENEEYYKNEYINEYIGEEKNDNNENKSNKEEKINKKKFLDLDVASNGNALEPFVIENMGDNANISGSKTWTIRNTGSLPGRLLLRLQNVVNEENGCNDQEKMADPTCEDVGKEGNLGDVINLKIALDGVDQVESLLSTDQADNIGTDWSAILPEIVLQPDEERTVTAYWVADENSYGNEIQSDSIQFDFNFRLINKSANPIQHN